MLWILRRTRLGAAAFFNVINNNSGSNQSNGNSSDMRPARNEYNKLSTPDDNVLHTSKLDNQNMEIEDCDTRLTTDLLDTDTDSSYTDFECEEREQYSDDSEYDESLTCNVCDRSFSCPRQLASHKQKKRHFGCSACDSLFPSLMTLEHHKEEFEHWSGDEIICTDSEESEDLNVAGEERERLL